MRGKTHINHAQHACECQRVAPEAERASWLVWLIALPLGIYALTDIAATNGHKKKPLLQPFNHLS